MSAEHWTIGVEIELLAPPGKTRRDLATALAERAHGQVRSFWHPQSEPSLVKGKPTFHNLTIGFEALDADGNPLARCVDDLTLQVDLDKQHPPADGWCRVVGDDDRLLRVISRQIDPEDAIEHSSRLSEVARDLFGVDPIPEPRKGLLRLVDDKRAPIAIVAGLPGERERPCELITPPLSGEQFEAVLRHQLAVAKELGFSSAAEGATHLHFDAERLCSANVIANIVELFEANRAPLRTLLGRNPRWQRTGPWPSTLFQLVRSPQFRKMDWDDARNALEQLQLSKYCDFNLKNIAHARQDCHTFEVRIIPVLTDPPDIVAVADLFAAMLEHCLEGTVKPAAPRRESRKDAQALLSRLPLTESVRDYWSQRI